MSTTLNNEERIRIAREAAFDALKASDIEYTEKPKSLNKDIIFDGEPLMWSVVGSTYIQDKQDTDVDILILVNNNPSEYGIEGWAFGGSRNEGNPDVWESWRKYVNGVDVNLILTNNRDYFISWLDAADVCRFLHLHGVALPTSSVHGIHAVIMDKASPEEEAETRGNY